jgi:class 3 adenylate cyclase/tetratricopeptide (TPR) repeat protein
MISSIEHRTYRLVTTLSYDLVDSTELMQRLGVESYAVLLEQIHQQFRALVEGAGGWAALPQGDDGCMCYFGARQVQAHAKESALQAALAMQHLAAERQWNVRLGLAYGQVAVHKDQPIGPSVHLAARLQKMAAAQQILVSTELAAQTSERFVYRVQALQQPCKGFSGVVQALQLCARNDKPGPPAADRPRPHLHGRQQLLKDLRKAWMQAQQGQTLFVHLQGEAGIGKTALVQELARQIQAPVLTWTCVHDWRQSAYQPLVHAIRRWAGIVADDEAQARQDKLDAALAETRFSSEQRWALAHLLELPEAGELLPALEDPQASESRMLPGLLAWLRLQTGHVAFLWVVEDLHWVDSASLRLLALLQQALAGTPVLLLSTRRPGGAAQAELQGQCITLEALGFEESSALILDLCGAQAEPKAVEWIAERAAGVPLFILEAVRLLLRPGLASGTPVHLSKNLPLIWMQHPQAGDVMGEGTREILMQRMDALGSARWLAQISSAIAAEFSLDMLLHVVAAYGHDAAIEGLMAQVEELVASGFLVRDPQGQQVLYRHSHALLREVAYQSIWATDRQRLHAAILSVYQQHMPQFVHSHPSAMAQHWLAAGEPEKAVEFFLLAALASKRRAAHSVSTDCCEAALALIEKLPERPPLQRLQLDMSLLAAGQIMATHGYGTDRAGQHFRQALRLSAALGDDKACVKAQLGLHSFHLLRGQFDAAEHFVQDGLQRPRAEGDALTRLLWCFAQAMLAFYRGQMRTSAETFQACERLCEAVPQSQQLIQSPQVMSLMYRAFCLWTLGQTEAAVALGRQGLALAQHHPFRLARIQAHGIHAMLMYCRGDWLPARHAAQAALEVAEQGEYILWAALARFVEGAARVQLGLRQALPELDMAQALAQMQQAEQQWAASCSVLTRPFFLTTLAQCHMDLRQWDAAQACLDLAQVLMTRHGERYFDTETQRTQAMLWLLKTVEAGPASQTHIQHLLEQAYTQAQQRGLHSLRLRVALSMADCERLSPSLCQWLGQRDGAARWLAESLRALPADSSSQDARRARELLALSPEATETRSYS